MYEDFDCQNLLYKYDKSHNTLEIQRRVDFDPRKDSLEKIVERCKAKCAPGEHNELEGCQGFVVATKKKKRPGARDEYGRCWLKRDYN